MLRWFIVVIVIVVVVGVVVVVTVAMKRSTRDRHHYPRLHPHHHRTPTTPTSPTPSSSNSGSSFPLCQAAIEGCDVVQPVGGTLKTHLQGEERDKGGRHRENRGKARGLKI